jgi:hypothetical protein
MSTLAAQWPSLTPQITTGNFATVNDAYDTTKPNNGAKNVPGSEWLVFDANNRLIKIKYVRYNPTAAGTEIVGPVYYKDNTFGTGPSNGTNSGVTATMSEAVTTKANSVAGILLNASVTPGNWTFIQVEGYKAAVTVPASTAVDDVLIGAAGFQIFGRVAAGTAPTNRPAAIALTAISGGVADILLCADNW